MNYVIVGWIIFQDEVYSFGNIQTDNTYFIYVVNMHFFHMTMKIHFSINTRLN